MQILEAGHTLIRIRGELLLRLTTSGASGGFHGAFGIAICNENAFTVGGVSSCLTPLADIDSDGWLYHRLFSFFPAEAQAVATAAQQLDQISSVVAALRVEVDSKSMRKLQADDVLYGCLDVIEVGTATLGMAFNSRVLVKLP